MGLCLIADLSVGSLLTWSMNILAMAVGLGVVIFVHELGHFLVAKACGVKCEKFYLGFDVPIRLGPITLPAALWKRRWGETEYGIGAIPLGGYVKMLGQDDNPANAEAEAERTRIRKPPQDADSTGTQDGECELDPRSFTAKSVPKRMAIISAGVIMNLIFAVVFATVAYRWGASYIPCEIGSTVPGSPAWIAGLEPGDRIIQIGRSGAESRHLRFGMDLRQNVGMTGARENLHLKIERPGAEEPFEVDLRPVMMKVARRSYPTIGVSPTVTPKLAAKNPVVPHFPAAKADPPFQGRDRIVGIEIDRNHLPIRTYHDLQAALAQHPEDELTFVVQRTNPNARTGVDETDAQAATRETRIPVKPNPMRRLGLVMKIGPITAVRKKSPAAKAGFEVGDVIQSMDAGEAVDPMTLPDVLRRRAGTPVKIVVTRARKDAHGQKEPHTEALTVTPQPPQMISVSHTEGGPVAAEAIGIAYSVLNGVRAVEPDGAAGRAGFRAHDRLAFIKFIAADKEKANNEDELAGRDKEFELDKALNWPVAFNRMQWSLPDTKVELTFRRGNETKKATLVPQDSDKWFIPHRGLKLTRKEEIHRAASWGEAMRLGVRNTKESMQQVFTFLEKLATGQVSPTNLGGPGTIAVMAASEANEGIPRLLLFLTLLSANLAILNFLPIPVLDGGHMLFLVYEGVRGKPVDEKWAFRLTVAGLSFILCLFVFVIGLDVYHIATWLT